MNKNDLLKKIRFIVENEGCEGADGYSGLLEFLKYVPSETDVDIILKTLQNKICDDYDYVLEIMEDEHEENLDMVDHFIYVLNRALQSDPDAIQNLINHRVKCNTVLAEDPTIQIGLQDDEYVVGMLGIINGLLGVDENSCGFISAVFDDDGNLIKFQRH